MDKKGFLSLRRFVRVVTEGGTNKEIDTFWKCLYSFQEVNVNFDFWKKSFTKK